MAIDREAQALRKKEADERKAELKKQTDGLKELSAQLSAQAEELKENSKVNRELAKLSKEEGNKESQREFTFQSISDSFMGITAQMKAESKAAQAERLQQRGDNLEKRKEEKALEKERLAKMGASKVFKEKTRDIKPGKTPNFIKTLAKLALGVIGVKVFTVMIKNFDKVKAFAKENIVPTLKKIFEFMQEFIFPNLDKIFQGMVAVAAAMIGAMIFGKILNAIKIVRAAFIALQVGILVTSANISTMLAPGGALSLVGRAITFLRAGFMALTAFTMTTLIPTLGSIVTTMAIAIAPFLPIVIGIGLAIAGIVFLLNKAKEALGFESIGDLMIFGVESMKDGFSRMGNLFIKIAKKIAGMGSKLLSMLGIGVPDFVDDLANMELLETDRAQKFREKTLARQEEEKLKKAQTTGTAESEIPEMPQMPQIPINIPTLELKDVQTTLKTRPVMSELGILKTQQLPALQQGRTDALSSQAAAASTSMAIQNISAPTTTNNSSSTTMYNDPTPAVDNFDGLARSF